MTRRHLPTGSRARAAGALLLLALPFAGCDLTSELQPDPKDVPPSEIISLATAAQQGNVGTGVSLDARIPERATAPSVVFTTSGGYFVETGTKTVTVRALPLDTPATGRLTARTLLRSDTAVTAIVRAAIGDRYDTSIVRFVKP